MADYDRTGHGLEVYWAEQGRGGEDLVGPGRSRIGLPTEPREPRQAQASAKDMSAPGVCGILRYKMPVPPFLSPARPLPVPALICHGLSLPNLPVSWPSPILTGSVLSNTALPAVPVQFC